MRVKSLLFTSFSKTLLITERRLSNRVVAFYTDLSLTFLITATTDFQITWKIRSLKAHIKT